MDWRDYIQVTQYITSICLFYKNVGVTWNVSDCEELVGVSSRVSDSVKN